MQTKFKPSILRVRKCSIRMLSSYQKFSISNKCTGSFGSFKNTINIGIIHNIKFNRTAFNSSKVVYLRTVKFNSCCIITNNLNRVYCIYKLQILNINIICTLNVNIQIALIKGRIRIVCAIYYGITALIINNKIKVSIICGYIRTII